MSVKEPHTCRYEVQFETPLACPVDAFFGEYLRQVNTLCDCKQAIALCIHLNKTRVAIAGKSSLVFTC